MPSYMSNDIIREVRYRKHLTRSDVQIRTDLDSELLSLSSLTVMRAEKKDQKLTGRSLKKVMRALEFPIESYFYPYFENLTTETLKTKSKLEFCASLCNEDATFLKAGNDLLIQMKKSGSFEEGVNKQYLMSYEAILLNEAFVEHDKVMNIAMQAINITYPEFNLKKYNGEVLVFEEATLIHSLAVSLLNAGQHKQAIKIIVQILKGLLLLPKDDNQKEKMLPPILLTLAKCYMAEKDYDKALEVCIKGQNTAIKRCNGFYAPDFARINAQCKHNLGDVNKATSLFTQAYAGYSLLRRLNAAKMLLCESYNTLGFRINTYGMETLSETMPVPEFIYGEIKPCKSKGELFGRFRYEADVTLSEISEGICSVSCLSKIESNDLEGNYYHLEAIMERYGRHIGNYFHTFMSKEEFREKQLRDEVKSLAVQRKYGELPMLLAKLASSKSFKKGVNLQFVELIRASLYRYNNGVDQTYLENLRKVLSITRKNLKLSNVTRTRFTHNELSLLNMIGLALCETGDFEQGLRLYKDIVTNMDTFIQDDNEKKRIYTLITRNYAHYLEKTNKINESMRFSALSEEIDLKFLNFNSLTFHSDNRACCLLKLGEKKKSLPYFAQAYYGSLLEGSLKDANAIQKYVLKELMIDLTS